jgi:hypothetical protein
MLMRAILGGKNVAESTKFFKRKIKHLTQIKYLKNFK